MSFADVLLGFVGEDVDLFTFAGSGDFGVDGSGFDRVAGYDFAVLVEHQHFETDGGAYVCFQ